MAEHPLLIFPEPTPAARAKRGGGGGTYQTPGARAQGRRFGPVFARLEQSLERRGAALQSTPTGIAPEQALVLETIGTVESFINAVQRITGLEWLAEMDLDDIEPGQGFFDERDKEKEEKRLLRGRLFLIMTDLRALRELVGLFKTWQKNPDANFTRGFAPWKTVFSHLYALRPWDAEDRIRDTGVFEDWQERIERGDEMVPFEAELWFRRDDSRRQQSARDFQNLVTELGGTVVQQCVIEQIEYHALLGRIPIAHSRSIMEQADVRLLASEDLMYLRPLGQCSIVMPAEGDQQSQKTNEDQPGAPAPKMDAPTVALFDGLPLSGHEKLKDRLVIDDPDDYGREYQATERRHGTAMASLICHGELDGTEEPLTTRLYVRPILRPRHLGATFMDERIPEDVLPVDLVHRCVRRLFEEEEGQPPAAPSVCIINLSVGDPARPFDRSVSPWGALLDWLAWKYNVLFIVSAGNHPNDINLDIPSSEFASLSAQERAASVYRHLMAETRHRRLLAPAETLNGITVGSAHNDLSRPTNGALLDPLGAPNLPAVTSAHGPGHRRMIKPDLLMPGGRQFLQESLHGNGTYRPVSFAAPPGQKVAAPGTQGSVTGTTYCRGTSNAAALASRGAARILDMLDALSSESEPTISPEYRTVLTKALLLHSAQWGDARVFLEGLLRTPDNGRTFRDEIARFLGYGTNHIGRVLACTDQRVIVLGTGALSNESAHEFTFPLPPSLAARTDWRRLTITLAYLSPVIRSRQRYRIAHLWYDAANPLASDREDADHRAVQRGTLQHEVFVGDKASDFQDGESIKIRVNCRADALRFSDVIRYGLAVTLEVAENISLPIYEEVRARLRVRVPVSAREDVR